MESNNQFLGGDCPSHNENAGGMAQRRLVVSVACPLLQYKRPGMIRKVMRYVEVVPCPHI